MTLSSIGLPGTNGFVGEFLILSGTWLSRLRSSALFATLAATGVILGAVYMLLLVEKVFFGKIDERPQPPPPRPQPSARWFVLVPMIALIVVMGLVPQPFLAPAKPAVDRLVQRFQAAEVRLGKGPQVGTADHRLRGPRRGGAAARAGRAGSGGAPHPPHRRPRRGPLT